MQRKNLWSQNRVVDSRAPDFRSCQLDSFGLSELWGRTSRMLASCLVWTPAGRSGILRAPSHRKTCTAAYRIPIRFRYFEMIGHHGHQHRQIKIAAHAPGGVEITFVRKRRACRQGDIPRRDGDRGSCVENGVVGDQSPAREQRRRRLRSRSLRTCCRNKNRQEKQTEHPRPPATSCVSKSHYSSFQQKVMCRGTPAREAARRLEG